MLSDVPVRTIALYSAITGNYEYPGEIVPATIADELSSGVDLFRFTDSVNTDIASSNFGGGRRWRHVQTSPRVLMDPIRSARAIKILGHPLLSQHDVTIWVDNRIKLKIGPEELVDRFLPSHSDVAVPLHSFHGSLAVEFAEILDGWVDDPRRVREQRSAYGQAVPALLEKPVAWTAILIRRNNRAVQAFNALWWEQILRYSRRDQLSFPYVCEIMRDVNVAHFAADNFESDFHEWRRSSDLDRPPHARLWNPQHLSREDLTDELRDSCRMLRARLKKGLTDRNRKR
jgi:hypothetical protein